MKEGEIKFHRSHTQKLTDLTNFSIKTGSILKLKFTLYAAMRQISAYDFSMQKKNHV